MKKILFISTALLASLTACEDYNDQLTSALRSRMSRRESLSNWLQQIMRQLPIMQPIRKSLCRKILKTVHM